MINKQKDQMKEAYIMRSKNLRGYSFETEEVYRARDEGKLLTLRLDTNYDCNLQCKYCYSSPLQTGATPQMSIERLKDVIDQAYELGLQSVVYLGGGEPLLYKHFWWFMEYLQKLDVVPVIFTNGTLITKEVARRLYQVGATVIIKMDGFQETQELLTGPGTYEKMQEGFQFLLDSGFGDLDNPYETRIGAAPCACTHNYQEIPEMWRYLREMGVYPNVERASCIGSAVISDLVLDKSQTAWLYKTLREIDEKEFDIQWESPYSGYPAHSCFISLVGCHVKADGGVALCSEFPSHANLADKSLAEILEEEIFIKVRNTEKLISAPCKDCDHLRSCLGGCRSKCLIGSGSLFGHDPSCTVCFSEKITG